MIISSSSSSSTSSHHEDLPLLRHLTRVVCGVHHKAIFKHAIANFLAQHGAHLDKVLETFFSFDIKLLKSEKLLFLLNTENLACMLFITTAVDCFPGKCSIQEKAFIIVKAVHLAFKTNDSSHVKVEMLNNLQDALQQHGFHELSCLLI
jgi:hypothetical protein